MELKALIFDMDGTLGDTMPFILQALQETFQRYAGKEYTHKELIAMFGPTEEGVIATRVPECDYPAALQYYLDRYDTLHQFVPKPFPGVIPMLDMLRKRAIHRGVVTGKGRGTAEISMRTMGLAPYIEKLVTGSASGGEKPEAIRQMLAEWGLRSGEAAYVGDMTSDMDAAREAGVIPLGAVWAKSSTLKVGDAARLFHSVDELRMWLEFTTL